MRLNKDDSKPKRMRWSTFNRICEHINERDERLGVDLALLLAPKGMLDLNELVADGDLSLRNRDSALSTEARQVQKQSRRRAALSAVETFISALCRILGEREKGAIRAAVYRLTVAHLLSPELSAT